MGQPVGAPELCKPAEVLSLSSSVDESEVAAGSGKKQSEIARPRHEVIKRRDYGFGHLGHPQRPDKTGPEVNTIRGA
jgi:hypothetical protein